LAGFIALNLSFPTNAIYSLLNIRLAHIRGASRLAFDAEKRALRARADEMPPTRNTAGLTEIYGRFTRWNAKELKRA